jgi:hypothetical protein
MAVCLPLEASTVQWFLGVLRRRVFERSASNPKAPAAPAARLLVCPIWHAEQGSHLDPILSGVLGLESPSAG